MKIVVVGAGVIGLSIAAELGLSGADVVVLEAAGPGSGTSATSYAWANSNGKDPNPYFELNLAGLEQMHAQGTGSAWFIPSGHVEWASDDDHVTSLTARVNRLLERNYPAEWITPARARQLSPALRIPDTADTIAWFPTEGYIHPALYVVELYRRATDAGARIQTHTRVVRIDPHGSGAVVHTNDGNAIEADVVVSCVGRWTEEVTEMMGTRVPMVDTTEVGGPGVGFLATTAPIPVDHPLLLSTSELNVRPAGGGRFQLQSTVLDATADPSQSYGLDAVVAQELRERFARRFSNAEDARIESFKVGQRAMPADGKTVIGHLANNPAHYVVATHSGVTMSLALGQWVTREVINEERVDLLQHFRPERLLDTNATFTAPVPRLPGQQ